MPVFGVPSWSSCQPAGPRSTASSFFKPAHRTSPPPPLGSLRNPWWDARNNLLSSCCPGSHRCGRSPAQSGSRSLCPNQQFAPQPVSLCSSLAPLRAPPTPIPPCHIAFYGCWPASLPSAPWKPSKWAHRKWAELVQAGCGAKQHFLASFCIFVPVCVCVFFSRDFSIWLDMDLF